MKKAFYRMMSSLSEITELPLNEMCREFSVSLTGRREITVSGVLSVNKYETDHIALAVCGGSVVITGEGLLLVSLYQTTLCIKGRIDSVEMGEMVCP